MIAFIDTETAQVMAVYSHRTSSSVWEKRGYARVEVPQHLERDVRRLGRNAVLTLNTAGEPVDVVARENPIQPDPPPGNPLREEYRLATTTAQKLSVLAKRLRLE